MACGCGVPVSPRAKGPCPAVADMHISDHVDNTLRVAAGCGGLGGWKQPSYLFCADWATGQEGSQTWQATAAGPRASPNFCYYLSRSVRLFETHHGHLEVDEMEGLVEYTGYLHVWVLQITTHFDSPLPPWWSPTPTRSEELSSQT